MTSTRNPFLIDDLLVEMASASVTKIARMCAIDADAWMQFAISVAVQRAYQFGLRKAGRSEEIAEQAYSAFRAKYFGGVDGASDSGSGWLRIHLSMTTGTAYKLGTAHMLAGQIKKADMSMPTDKAMNYTVDLIEDLLADGNQWVCDQMIRACTWQDLSVEMCTVLLNATEQIKDYLEHRAKIYEAIIQERKMVQ